MASCAKVTILMAMIDVNSTYLSLTLLLSFNARAFRDSTEVFKSVANLITYIWNRIRSTTKLMNQFTIRQLEKLEDSRISGQGTVYKVNMLSSGREDKRGPPKSDLGMGFSPQSRSRSIRLHDPDTLDCFSALFCSAVCLVL